MISSEAPPDPSAPDADGLPDAELMRLASRGDASAFETVVMRYQQRVANHAFRMLGDMAAAEDVTQQVFVQAWRAAGRYQPTAKLTTWLLRITRNIVLNELRRRHRKPVQSLDAENLPESFSATPRHESPDARASAEELEKAVEQAVLGLPEKQREALLLFRHQDLSYEEIAAIMKTSVSSVKSLIFRARAELKERLKAHLGAL